MGRKAENKKGEIGHSSKYSSQVCLNMSYTQSFPQWSPKAASKLYIKILPYKNILHVKQSALFLKFFHFSICIWTWFCKLYCTLEVLFTSVRIKSFCLLLVNGQHQYHWYSVLHVVECLLKAIFNWQANKKNKGLLISVAFVFWLLNSARVNHSWTDTSDVWKITFDAPDVNYLLVVLRVKLLSLMDTLDGCITACF